MSWSWVIRTHNHLLFSYVPSYISSFFSLPVKRESGEHLTHEEVINKLDSETVSYEPSLGIGDQFCECLRVGFKVEIAHYETAVEWLKDLIYGSEFNQERWIAVFFPCSTLLLTRRLCWKGYKSILRKSSSRCLSWSVTATLSCHLFGRTCCMLRTRHPEPAEFYRKQNSSPSSYRTFTILRIKLSPTSMNWGNTVSLFTWWRTPRQVGWSLRDSTGSIRDSYWSHRWYFKDQESP